jgi:hypothetical protein
MPDMSSSIKKKYEIITKLANQPPLYTLMRMPEFGIKHTAFFYCTHSEKLVKLKQFLSNTYVSENAKDEFLEKYARFQRTINGFKKLVRRWRLSRKYVVYPNTTDLKGVELSEYKPHLVINLVENGTIYGFYILDLLKMWNIALKQRMYVIETPHSLRNPYTNLPFTKTNLYNIYFKAHFSGIKKPMTVEMCFQCRFSMPLLMATYGAQLREMAIVEYSETEDISLYHELMGIQADYGSLLPMLSTNTEYTDDIKMFQIKKYKPLIQAFCFMSYSTNNHLVSQFNTMFHRLADAYNANANSFI